MGSAGDALAVKVGGTEHVAVVTVRGEVDAASVGELSEVLDAIVRGHERHAVVDASGVTFIDSTGVSAIMDAQRRLNRSRRRLGVACDSQSALGRALAMTGLQHTLECHAAVQDAVAELEAAPLLGR